MFSVLGRGYSIECVSGVLQLEPHAVLGLPQHPSLIIHPESGFRKPASGGYDLVNSDWRVSRYVGKDPEGACRPDPQHSQWGECGMQGTHQCQGARPHHSCQADGHISIKLVGEN